MRLTGDISRQGEASLTIETLDDLWYLHELIEPGDTVSGKTPRKMKATEEAEGIKRWVFMAVRVQQAQFSESSSTLRVLGTVLDGPEDIPRGTHHTIAIEPGMQITLAKPEWLGFQRDRLKEACAQKPPKILICVFDREEARFARLTAGGHEQLVHLKGDVQRKRMETKSSKDFFEEIVAQVRVYDERYHFERIILASPAFWKDELLKRLTDPSLRKKSLLATCSGADASALGEVLRRDEVRAALAADRITREVQLVDELMKRIRTGSKAAYGIVQVKAAAAAGAIETLMVSDKTIHSRRASGTFAEIEALLRDADRAGGKVVIVSASHEGGQRLDGLGGIAALLRFAVE